MAQASRLCSQTKSGGCRRASLAFTGGTPVPREPAMLDGRPEWTRTIDLFRVKEAL